MKTAGKHTNCPQSSDNGLMNISAIISSKVFRQKMSGRVGCCN